MDKLLALLLFLTAIGAVSFVYPDGFLAVLFGAVCSAIAFILINIHFHDAEKDFIKRIFIGGLALRIILAILTNVFNLQGFFGGDSITYDNAGLALYNTWFGYVQSVDSSYYLNFASRTSGSGWGMAYVVAGVYSLIGRNAFAVQILNCVLGAATACLTYTCAKKIFSNNRVAKLSAILVAIFPSLIIWTSQGLKDGIICFLLVLSMTLVFSLQKQLNYFNIILLLLSLGGIYALRFYIFFAFAASVLGSFFLNTQKSASSIAKQVVVLLVITIGLTYFGVLSSAQKNIQSYDLKSLQNSRLDQAKSAESGFGQDIDVSTSSGAIEALPVGLTYIMLAPFPWQVSNFRQAITIPEVLIWWCMIPFMIFGIIYSIKNKFRQSLGVLCFTLLLTVSYAIFQGNVGTAYRMRAQMQIFYFIFVAAGIVLWQEKRENQAVVIKANRRKDLQRNQILR